MLKTQTRVKKVQSRGTYLEETGVESDFRELILDAGLGLPMPEKMSEVDVEQATVRVQHDVAWMSVLRGRLRMGERERKRERERERESKGVVGEDEGEVSTKLRVIARIIIARMRLRIRFRLRMWVCSAGGE